MAGANHPSQGTGTGSWTVPVRASYYLFGPERALVRFYRESVRRGAEDRATADGQTLSVRRFEGEDAWSRAAAEARLISFDPYRLILALPAGVPDLKTVAGLAKALENPASGVTLLVEEPVWSGRERPAQRLSPLRKGPLALEARELRPQEALSFAAQAAKELGLSIQAGALQALFRRTGHRLDSCLTELEKFHASLPTSEVTVQTVEWLTPSDETATIFPVGDALLAGDLRAALCAAEQALSAGQSAFGLVGYIARQVSLITQAQSLIRAGKGGPASAASDEAVAKALGVAPWQGQKMVRAARRSRFDGTSGARAILEAQLGLRSSTPERLVVAELLWNLLGTYGVTRTKPS